MSKFLTQNAIASFASNVKQAWQGASQLRATVNLKTGVVGSTHRFNKIGKGLATKRIAQTDVVPMNIVHGNATAVLEDWNAAEYTDIFNQQKVPYSEVQALANVIAKAIGRREDQMVIDALDAAATAHVVPTSVGADAGMNVAKLLRAKALLDDNDVDDEERYMAISARGLEQLLGNTEVTSADFNAVKSLVHGEVDYFLGFKFKKFGKREEGGLPISGTTRTSFAYQKEAVGLAIGKDFSVSVDWIAHKTSWLSNGMFIGGATAIDADGIVEIETTEA